MAWRPQLNVVCGRRGKPRGLTHDCVSNSKRKQTARPQLSFGKCPKCHKPYEGNPLAHTCAPKSDFRRRKAAHEKEQRAKAKKKRQQAHDYTECSDKDCPRPLCVAFKTGYLTGYRDGYDRGWQAGYDAGFPDGIAACPRTHK